MSGEITVRRAEESDAGLVQEFIRQLAAYERLEGEVTATEEGLRETLFGKERYAEVLLAFVAGEAAGFAVYFFTYSTFMAKPGLYLEDLFVAPEWRGKGIGRKLFGELVQVAEQRGCGRMEWSVLDWNEPAVKFYEKLGAIAQKEWVRYRLEEQEIKRLAACKGG